VLSIDPKIDSNFNSHIVLTTAAFDSTASQEQNFTKTFFNDIPAMAALAILTKFQHNIKVIEAETIDFCNNQVAYLDGYGYYTSYNAFAIISSNCAHPKEQLEVIAAVGAFSKAALPVITIDSRNVPLDFDGASHYNFKAPNKPGKYTVPVEITYRDEEGKEQKVMKTIKYTVAGDK
jgi:hypothetical protein